MSSERRRPRRQIRRRIRPTTRSKKKKKKIERKRIIKKISNHNIPLHTDAVQALGKIEIDVNELGIDYLSLSAHKFYGPKGVGALFVNKNNNIKPFIIGGDQENGLRGGTENIAGIVGMGLAAELAIKDQNTCVTKLKKLEKHFLNNLKEHIPSAKHNKTNNLPGLISISFPGNKSNILMAKLDRASIAVSNGSACNTGNIKPSKVLCPGLGINFNLTQACKLNSFGIIWLFLDNSTSFDINISI